MDHVSLINQFIAWEEKNSLFSLKIQGRLFWDYIRYPTFDYLHRNLLGQDEIILPIKKNKSRIQNELIGLLKSCLTKNKVNENNQILIINYDRKNLIDDKLVNPHFYPFIKTFASKYNILLADPSRYNVPVEGLYECPVIRLRPYQYRARLRAKLMRFLPDELELLGQLTQSFQNDFKTNVSLLEIAQTYFIYQIALGLEYKKLFKKIKPKLIIYSDNGASKGWIEEAHKENIAVFDYQHSLMSDANILYHYGELGSKEKLLTTPDTILTFGTFWETYYHLNVPKKAVGFPYLEQRKEELKLKLVKDEKGIVIISSMHSGKKLEKMALELAHLLPDYPIYYKLRPEEFDSWKEVYSKEFQTQKNIQVIDNNKITLYELFASSSYQIGINSTALIEGFVFDLTTFIFKDGWYQEMQPFYEKNIFFLVETAKEIADKISMKIKTSNTIMSDLLFRKNSLSNLEELLAHLKRSF